MTFTIINPFHTIYFNDFLLCYILLLTIFVSFHFCQKKQLDNNNDYKSNSKDDYKLSKKVDNLSDINSDEINQLKKTFIPNSNSSSIDTDEIKLVKEKHDCNDSSYSDDDFNSSDNDSNSSDNDSNSSDNDSNSSDNDSSSSDNDSSSSDNDSSSSDNDSSSSDEKSSKKTEYYMNLLANDKKCKPNKINKPIYYLNWLFNNLKKNQLLRLVGMSNKYKTKKELILIAIIKFKLFTINNSLQKYFFHYKLNKMVKIINEENNSKINKALLDLFSNSYII